MDETLQVHIWYDNTGAITAIGVPSPAFRDRVTPVPNLGENILILEVAAHQVQSLRSTHCVDMNTNELKEFESDRSEK
ncbi:MAG: hypothetical protein ABI743_07725 [bacterium]